MMKQRGFSLIEVVVALLLLSVSALAVTEALLTAQRAQRLGGQWMRAADLAEQAIERARATRLGGNDRVGEFRRRWTVETADADLRLTRIQVEIDWGLPRPQHFTLAALVR